MVVSGTVNVTADATDDNGVSQVEFFVDSNSIGLDTDGSNGWSISWDTTAYTNSSHYVSATASDTIGQTASDSVSVTVDNESTTNNPPTVTITNPEDGATVSSTISVSADTTDDNGVSQIEFFVDNNSIGIDSDGSDGWGVSWDTTVYSDGGHTVSATATDTIGQSTSDSVSVTVDNNTGGITLSANGYKIRGDKYVDLMWSGATSTDIDVYRNNAFYTTTPNDGAYTAGPLGVGGGSDTFMICEAGTSTCSNEVTINW